MEPAVLDDRRPDAVRELMAVPGDRDALAEAEVDGAGALERVDELLGARARAGAAQPLDEGAGREPALERDEADLGGGHGPAAPPDRPPLRDVGRAGLGD